MRLLSRLDHDQKCSSLDPGASGTVFPRGKITRRSMKAHSGSSFWLSIDLKISTSRHRKRQLMPAVL